LEQFDLLLVSILHNLPLNKLDILDLIDFTLQPDILFDVIYRTLNNRSFLYRLVQNLLILLSKVYYLIHFKVGHHDILLELFGIPKFEVNVLPAVYNMVVKFFVFLEVTVVVRIV
jgi:hypothetical protein